MYEYFQDQVYEDSDLFFSFQSKEATVHEHIAPISLSIL
jgi:hypothetical protein